MPAAKLETPLVPDFEITINGAPLPLEAKANVLAVMVEDDVGLPGMFTFQLAGSMDQEDEAPWVDDEDLFAVGHAVEIKMGYGEELESLIAGEITGLEPEFASNHLPTLSVRGYDRRHRLHRGRKTRTFVQQKDSEVAAQIAKDAGLNAQAEDTQVVHDYVLQANQTDMDFLQERARRIHYEVIVNGKDLLFRPVAHAEGEILTLSLQEDLLEFCPRLSAVRQINEIALRGWDPKNKKEFVGRAKSGDEATQMGGQNNGAALVESFFGAATSMVGDRPVSTQAEADQLAKARFNNVALALICGEGVCFGRTDLRSGKVIKVEGLGTRFSGQYYVTTASHRYSGQLGYYTHFTVRRNAL